MEIARTKLSDQLVMHLAREIVRGELKPGEPLASHPEVAAGFGISKPIVRESLQVLASVGLVRVQQGKRTVVLEESEWNVLDPVVQKAFALEGRGAELAEQLYDVRVTLEVSSAAHAAERARPDDVAELNDLVEEMRTIAATTRDRDHYLQIDRAFHEAIARASGNVVLRQLIRNVHLFLTSAWSRTSIRPDELDLLTELHADIAHAIEEGDPERAQEAMRSHLERAAAKEASRRRGKVRA